MVTRKNERGGRQRRTHSYLTPPKEKIKIKILLLKLCYIIM